MELKFNNPGVDYMINSIMVFQSDEQTAFWSEPLYYFYPALDKTFAQSLAFAERKRYIEQTLRGVYLDIEKTIEEKVIAYTKHWEKYTKQIAGVLTEVFGVDCDALFNTMECNISMNPISPRFLKEQKFEIFYLNSERGALGVAMHEIIHFVWFYVWKQVFEDTFEEYESPSMKWILSEMVVESIMSDTRLSSINPYFPRENGGCIYPYFFDMKVNGKLVLDILDEMYRSYDIREFMKESYAFCLANEEEIRKHIERAERI